MTIIQFKIARYFIVYINFIVFIALVVSVALKSIFEFIINFNVLNKKVYEIIKFKVIDKTQVIILFIITIMFFFDFAIVFIFNI